MLNFPKPQVIAIATGARCTLLYLIAMPIKPAKTTFGHPKQRTTPATDRATA
jgi:hypothetical protein